MSSMSSMGGKGGMMSGNLPYILGGVALAGVGAYLYFSKSSTASTSTAPALKPMTSAESAACQTAFSATDAATRNQGALAVGAAMAKGKQGTGPGAVADLRAFANSVRAKYPAAAACYDRTADQIALLYP